ncbi:MAG: metallopeptidase TldD-related protein [Clostridiales bacterium]
MFSFLINYLTNFEKIQDWKIIERKKDSIELYFIKKELDMHRSVEVLYYDVTLYVENKKEGKTYLGESNTVVSPTMKESEVIKVLNDCYQAACYVYNKPFTILKKKISKDTEVNQEISPFALDELIKGMFEHDLKTEGGLGACEIFLYTRKFHIITSKGIDVIYKKQDAMVELVSYWINNKKEVELFDNLYFGYLKKEELSQKVKVLLEETEKRSKAEPMKDFEGIPVILEGDNVSEFFNYFVMKSNAQTIYEGISNYYIDFKIQNNPKGDLLEITLKPYLESSSRSTPYDNDGVLLKTTPIIEDGVVKNIHGEHRFTSYLDLPTTGMIPNFSVGLGTTDLNELKTKPHIVLKKFSDFQTNSMTGDFGGEIRFAQYFDGKSYNPLTCGTISSNVNKVVNSMKFSNEKFQSDIYEGPKAIIFDNLKVSK